MPEEKSSALGAIQNLKEEKSDITKNQQVSDW